MSELFAPINYFFVACQHLDCGETVYCYALNWPLLKRNHFVRLCVSWWVGEWQKCSASCGGSGQTKRTVLCIQAVSAEEQKALPPKDCEHVPKPESVLSCNTHIPCPANWTTGGWSKVRPREVYARLSLCNCASYCAELPKKKKTLFEMNKRRARHFNISLGLWQERNRLIVFPQSDMNVWFNNSGRMLHLIISRLWSFVNRRLAA